MKIIKATHAELERVMEIYAIAVKYMQSNGNPTQWQGGYPFRETVAEDIDLGRLYLLIDDNSHIIAQFCFYVGDDPTYAYIDGEWLNDNSYGVVHRIASSAERGGVAKICLDWCFEQHPNIRIDTHTDNAPMLHTLRQNGYTECGEIIVYNGTRRVAFQRTK
ncbi:MAG: GNAT family N-acetyltransferase [Rikenellaceae bacterium]